MKISEKPKMIKFLDPLIHCMINSNKESSKYIPFGVQRRYAWKHICIQSCGTNPCKIVVLL